MTSRFPLLPKRTLVSVVLPDHHSFNLVSSFPFHYEAFGSRLSTNLEFPELRRLSAGPARWTFSVVDEMPVMVDARLLGEERIYAEVRACLYKHRDGHRIEVGDTGQFQIDSDGRWISWQPTAEPWWDFGRGHLVGRVLATAMHLDGIPTLHGSAVQMAEGVVGFLAAKGTGKSTLALHLTRAGLPLVTDDSLPIEFKNDAVLAHPGIHTIRLRTIEEAGSSAEPTGRDRKFRISDMPAEQRMVEPHWLATLYLLRSVKANSTGAPVMRVSVPGPQAVMRLQAFAKIGEMLGSAARLELLETAAVLARRIRIEELHVVQDLSLLPEVVAQLISWHGLPPGQAVADSA